MQSINHHFDRLMGAGFQNDLGHLQPFVLPLEGQGRNGGQLLVRVSYQSHVFSKTPTQADEGYDFIDETGARRRFCDERYRRCLKLPETCRSLWQMNALTWVSKDRNRASNMAVIEDRHVSGRHYAVIYYLFPSRNDHIDIEMVVKSAYEKYIDFSHIKRKFRMIQLAKKSYYEGKVVP